MLFLSNAALSLQNATKSNLSGFSWNDFVGVDSFESGLLDSRRNSSPVKLIAMCRVGRTCTSAIRVKTFRLSLWCGVMARSYGDIELWVIRKLKYCNNTGFVYVIFKFQKFVYKTNIYWLLHTRNGQVLLFLDLKTIIFFPWLYFGKIVRSSDHFTS